MIVFNTLSGQKEEFSPRGNVVTMYVCGVTPYDECHIGHAMSYITFDAIRRYLEYRGYRVKYVQNFTDIDDKIIERANRQNISAKELSSKFIEQYFIDMDELNIKRADVYPRATEEIPGMIKLINGLIEKGHAYNTSEGVYFRVISDHEYGKLSHRILDSMIAGARVEAGAEKEHPLDFSLWKAAKPGEPAWDSPWGKGRPGWHIECSAMALRYLGNTIDIHGGGQDLVFPHHENEIAQSECFTGIKPFVRYWLHNGLLQFGGDKMSKSLGNLITIKEALRLFSADAIRLFVISSNYRTPLTYNEETLKAMQKGAERLRQALSLKASSSGDLWDAGEYRQRFIEAMDDDFNTAQAVAALFDLTREINRASSQGFNFSRAQEILRELCLTLGLTLREEKELPSPEPLLELLVKIRGELRAAKQWPLADMIRTDLLKLGITIEDSSAATTWKYSKPD